MEAPTMKPSLTLLVAMLVAGGALASDVFKTTDSKGQPVYTDRPATLPAERLDVRTQTTDKVEVQQRYDEQMKTLAATEKAQTAQAADAADAAQASELSATAKVKRCEDARQRYESYMNARRLYEPGASEEERRYLTDAEIDAAREKALQVMNTFCNEG
jgi:uncharacterized protein DUF4124